jgi:hypothetical protein
MVVGSFAFGGADDLKLKICPPVHRPQTAKMDPWKSGRIHRLHRFHRLEAGWERLSFNPAEEMEPKYGGASCHHLSVKSVKSVDNPTAVFSFMAPVASCPSCHPVQSSPK